MNGCWNRKDYKPEYRVWEMVDGQQKEVIIPFKNTVDCQYTLSNLGQKDEKCVGCNRKRLTTE